MRAWIAILAAVTSVAAFVPLAQHRASADGAQTRSLPALASAQPAPKKAAGPPPLTGVEIDKLVVRDDEVVAPAALGRTAHLSIDPSLQRTASRILREYAFPEAAVVVLETTDGRVLAWANHVENGPFRDLCLEATTIANTVANQGEMVRPVIVESVADPSGSLYQAPKRTVVRRAILPETAAALTTMMETTIRGGTSYRAFHDAEGRPFLPNIAVAGKTGTLTRAETQQFYTWFVGFAPSRAPEVAIAVLVVNTPSWRAKANVVAREVLRAYFAAKGAPGVTRP